MSSARVESFSDAVFAIAITLLVLDIRQPAETGPLWHAVLRQWPSFLAYALSFLLIGVVWVNHHLVFHLIARVDMGLLWYNLLLLLVVAFMPYPTVLLADSLVSKHGETTAAVCYGATLVVVGMLFNLTWLHASHNHRLLHPEAAPGVVRAMGLRLVAGSALCAVITLVALIQVDLSLAGYLLVLAYYGISDVRRGDKDDKGNKGEKNE